MCRVVDDMEEKLREAEQRVKALAKRLPAEIRPTGQKPEEKSPQVWHRDRSRPTFARVYVGDGNALELVSLHVSVTIEGPRARTVVDHVFRNPHDRQLEGTFEYPLPSGASPSYFAMFLGQTRDTAPARFNRRGDQQPLPADALARLTPAELVKQVDTTDWGRLQEARIVSKEKALETYEEVVRGRIDPALLEYAGGNTFSGRVFPIPPKGYNRVILAYEELLPFAQEHMIYRFPLPDRKLNELQFTLQARADECLKPSFLPKDAGKDESNGRVTFSRTWKDSKPEGEVVFACTPADPQVQAVSGRQGDNGPRYLYARLRPQLKTVAKDNAFASHAVFLLDTSLSEHPERFDVNVRLLRKILETDPDIKHFNVLTFNVGAAWLDPNDWMDNSPAGREKALKKLDGLVLEGATDISCALEKLVRPGFDVAAGTNLDVFLLSDGHITWGEPDVAALVARFEQRCPYATRFHCYRTGLGEENGELFEALTRKGGGVFQCFGEAELEAAARAHRSQCLQRRARPLRRRAGSEGRPGSGASRRRLPRRRAGRGRSLQRDGPKYHCGGRRLRRPENGAGVSRRDPERRRAGPSRLGRGGRGVAAGPARQQPRSVGDSLLSAVRHRQSGRLLPRAGERGRLQALQPGGGARQNAGRRPRRFPRRRVGAAGQGRPRRQGVRALSDAGGQARQPAQRTRRRPRQADAYLAQGRRLRASGRLGPGRTRPPHGQGRGRLSRRARARPPQRSRVSEGSAAPRRGGRRGRRRPRAVQHHRGVSDSRRRPAPGRLSTGRSGAGGAGGAAVQPGAEAAAVRAAQLPRPGPRPGGERQVRPGRDQLRDRPGRHLAQPFSRTN